MSLTLKSTNKVFAGELRKYAFTSTTLGGLETSLNVFLPPSSLSSDTGAASQRAPLLYFLSGLTCTEDNAAQKGAFFQQAALDKVALVFPDTSPRGANIEGEDDSYDFGTGAGFYLNATKEPWSKHYNMYDFITQELPQKLKEDTSLPLDHTRVSIFGHSMGGHGALVLYLRNRALYRSVSAFSPIAHPTAAPWGQKAFPRYLAHPDSEAEQYDATLLVSRLTADSKPLDVLIDCGTADDFYKQGQLRPEAFDQAVSKAGVRRDGVRVRLHDGYDHSYFFISTFAPEHISWHAKFLHGSSA